MFPAALRNLLRCLAGGIVVYAFQAQAQVTVTDDGFSFSPDPVYIVAGETVDWQDDGSGPYAIISDTGAWTTFYTPGGLYFDQTGTYGYSDDAGDTGTIVVTPNIPPTVTITYPTNNTVLTPPATFNFSADASDTDADGLSDVEFYVGTNLVDDIFTSPFTTTVSGLAAGTYTLTAIAYDNVGATATNQVTITVGVPLPILLKSPRIAAGTFRFDVTGLTIGKTNIVEATTNLASAASWVFLSTNVASASTMSFTNPATFSRRNYRLVQLP
jgi:plastocyanin